MLINNFYYKSLKGLFNHFLAKERKLKLSSIPFETIVQQVYPHARIDALDRLQGGVTNRNIKIAISNPKDILVLRIYQNRNGKNRAQKELAVLLRLRSANPCLPVPKTVYTDFSKQIIDWPYALRTYLPGELLSRFISQYCSQDLERIGFDIGRLLALLHLIPVSSYGDPFSKKGTLLNSEYSYFMSRLDEKIEFCKNHKILQNHILNQLISRIREYEYTLNGSQPCLIHYDYHERNLLIFKGASPQVSGILDFENALGWSREADMAKIFNNCFDSHPLLLNGFVLGYGSITTLTDVFPSRLYIYRLLQSISYITYGAKLEYRTFVDKNIWELERLLSTTL